jgi:hypothetical protein
MFHLCPYWDLPEDLREKYQSVRVDVQRHLYDPEIGAQIYNDALDELEFSSRTGYDGIRVNLHHQNAYGLMPSPNIMAVSLARDGRLDLLCRDEFGYVHLHRRGAELLFQVLTEREERASVAVASNAPPSEWGQTFTDPRLAAAVVDRLTFRAHVIETGSESYRLRVSRTSKGGARES